MRPSLTMLCTGCAARVPAGTTACPRCGGRALLDLREAAVRRGVAAALVVRPRSTLIVRGLRRLEEGVLPVARFATVVVVPVTFVVAAAHRGSVRVAALLAGIVAVLMLTSSGLTLVVVSTTRALSAGVEALVRWVRRAKPARRHAWPVAAPRATGEVERVRVRGRVQAAATMPSPLSHVPCVAFRLVGTTAGSEIDDAALVAFDVVTDGGEVVHVPEGPATVALEADGDPVAVTPDESLARFLDERAGLVTLGPVRLAEAVLVDGNEVVVEGVETVRAVQVGYRDARDGRVIVERDGAPRVVRRP